MEEDIVLANKTTDELWEMVKDPFRIVEALSQQTSDMADEKGIEYTASYCVTQAGIGIVTDEMVFKPLLTGFGSSVSELFPKAKVLDTADDAIRAASILDDLMQPTNQDLTS